VPPCPNLEQPLSAAATFGRSVSQLTPSRGEQTWYTRPADYLLQLSTLRIFILIRQAGINDKITHIICIVCIPFPCDRAPDSSASKYRLVVKYPTSPPWRIRGRTAAFPISVTRRKIARICATLTIHMNKTVQLLETPNPEPHFPHIYPHQRLCPWTLLETSLHTL